MLPQIGKFIGRFKVDRRALSRVHEVTLQDLVGETDLRTPALQDVLLAGVVDPRKMSRPSCGI